MSDIVSWFVIQVFIRIISPIGCVYLVGLAGGFQAGTTERREDWMVWLVDDSEVFWIGGVLFAHEFGLFMRQWMENLLSSDSL